MNRRYLPMLLVLALVWGSSFMFIKVAVRDLDPATLVLGRLGVAALTLGLVVPLVLGAKVTLTELRAHWPWLAAVGLLNTAVPFWLLSWGETRIDSGLASIIQASVPIFNALLAFGFFHEQRVKGRNLVGVAVGFVGVALLVGAQPQAKILAPDHVPGWKPIASVVFLGVVGTAFAYLLFYTIIAGAGAAYASLVTYLVPPVALAYGAVFLGERIGWPAIVGLVLILTGVALGTGRRRRVARHGALVAAPSEPT